MVDLLTDFSSTKERDKSFARNMPHEGTTFLVWRLHYSCHMSRYFTIVAARTDPRMDRLCKVGYPGRGHILRVIAIGPKLGIVILVRQGKSQEAEVTFSN